MVAPDFGVHVAPYLALAVRSLYYVVVVVVAAAAVVVAFRSDWLTAPVCGLEMDVAALNSPYFAQALAGGHCMLVGIDFGSFLAWPSAVA